MTLLSSDEEEDCLARRDPPGPGGSGAGTCDAIAAVDACE